MIKYKKVIIPAFAVIATLVITLSAFKGKEQAKEQVEGKIVYAPTYFHFIGSPGQEQDVTKWAQISADEYTDTYANCNKPNDGCRLRTDSTQMVSGIIRPKSVEVNVVGTHLNPKTSTASGVTAVGNQNP